MQYASHQDWALHIVAKSLNLKKGDKVALPITFLAGIAV